MKQVVIVEDDVVVATAFKGRFTKMGWKAHHAPDGVTGIELITAEKPDVVLLDLLMPRMDGIEVLKYIRGHPEINQLPVVVFSNSYMTNMVEKAWKAGADEVLMKAATTPQQLFDAVAKAIAKAAKRRAAASPPKPVATPPVDPLAASKSEALPLEPDSATLRPPGARAGDTEPDTVVITTSAAAAAMGIPSESNSAQNQVPEYRPTVVHGKAVSTTHLFALTQPDEKNTTFIQAEADPEFQEKIRQLFVKCTPSLIVTIRTLVMDFVEAETDAQRLEVLDKLSQKVQGLTGNAAVANCLQIAQFARMYATLVKEMQQKPRFINASTMRTAASALDFLEFILPFTNITTSFVAGKTALVLEPDDLTSQSIELALDKADIRATVTSETTAALKLVDEQTFDLVIVAATLKDMSGLDFMNLVHAATGYKDTPLMMVSDLNTFVPNSNPMTLGENDIIGKPFLLTEMTLKSVMHLLLREAMRRQADVDGWLQQEATGTGTHG